MEKKTYVHGRDAAADHLGLPRGCALAAAPKRHLDEERWDERNDASVSTRAASCDTLKKPLSSRYWLGPSPGLGTMRLTSARVKGKYSSRPTRGEDERGERRGDDIGRGHELAVDEVAAVAPAEEGVGPRHDAGVDALHDPRHWYGNGRG